MAMGGMPNQNVPLAQQPPPQQEKLDYAIEFLERVKVVYADKPAVYNQFLDIMKVRHVTSPHSASTYSGLLPPYYLPLRCLLPPTSNYRSLRSPTFFAPAPNHTHPSKSCLPHDLPPFRLAPSVGSGSGR